MLNAFLLCLSCSVSPAHDTRFLHTNREPTRNRPSLLDAPTLPETRESHAFIIVVVLQDSYCRKMRHGRSTRTTAIILLLL